MAPTSRWSESVEQISRQRATAPVLQQPIHRKSKRRRQQAGPQSQSGWQRQHAFTLVELLVVISIIALLISILLPSLKQAREQAKTVKCLANSRGLGQASMTFAVDHDGFMQLTSDRAGQNAADPDYSRYAYGTQNQATPPKRELLAWPTALAQATGMTGMDDNWDWGVRAEGFSSAKTKEASGLVSETFEVGLCPSDRIKLATPFWPKGTTQLFGSGDPNDPSGGVQGNTSYWGRLSYGVNEDLLGSEGAADSGGTVWKDGAQNSGRRLRGKLDVVYDPATVMLIMDAGRDNLEQKLDDFPMLLISKNATGPFLENVNAQFKRFPEKRHPKGQLNVTYADGHGAPTRPVGKVFYGRTGPFPERYSNPTRVSPYAPKNLPIRP